MRARTRERIARLVASRRPDLMILTDDVYATFSEGFRSLAAELPRNTIGLYSFSKYFGATGWRLGVVLLHRDNVVDAAIAALPAARRAAVDARYSPVALDPREFRFIDRVAADSRQVALNHVAGLSTPQQAQMTLFALYALMDGAGTFRSAARAVVRRRLEALYTGMGLPVPQDALSTHYYATVDIALWLEREHGPDFARFVQARYEPLDVVFRLAEEFATVLLPGGGFDAPQWSVRISLANLPDAVYPRIGADLRAVVEEYVAAWRAARGAPSQG
jgi:aspartate 4-decarboxylase